MGAAVATGAAAAVESAFKPPNPVTGAEDAAGAVTAGDAGVAVAVAVAVAVVAVDDAALAAEVAGVVLAGVVLDRDPNMDPPLLLPPKADGLAEPNPLPAPKGVGSGALAPAFVESGVDALTPAVMEVTPKMLGFAGAGAGAGGVRALAAVVAVAAASLGGPGEAFFFSPNTLGAIAAIGG